MSGRDEMREISEGLTAAQAFENGELTITDEPVELPEPPVRRTDPDDTLVVTTVRLTVRQRRAAEEVAVARGVDLATLIRGWVDQGLAEVESDYQVSAADIKRMLAGLRHTA